jgi:hypothetical protein
MKRRLIALSLIAALGLLAMPSRGSAVDASYYDDYDDTQSHPVRIAAYVLHPVGYAAEWLIFRPFHYVISLPYVAEVFGHQAHSRKSVY